MNLAVGKSSENCLHCFCTSPPIPIVGFIGLIEEARSSPKASEQKIWLCFSLL